MKSSLIRCFSRTLPGLCSWMRDTTRVDSVNKLKIYVTYSRSSFRSISSITDSLLAHSEGHESSEEKVKFTFILNDGEHVEVEGKVGETVMNVAVENELGMEGACEGSLACTTCHVYVDDKVESVVAPACPKEEDMLDIAPFLKPNSRLSCQLFVSKELEGVCFKVPPGTMNMAVDGHKPKKH